MEYVFLDNFIIDCILMTLARKGLKLQTKKFRIVLSALFGATVAVLLPLLKLGVAIGFALKMPIGLLIVLLSGKFRNIKEYVKCFYLFLFFTFCFGGGVTVVFWGLGLSFDPISYSNSLETPIFLILAIAIGLYFLIEKTVRVFYRKREVNKFTYKCQAEIGGKNFEFIGFLDSGNSLIYKETESPIVICSKKFGEKLKKSGALDFSLQDVITVNTVAGKSFLPIYKTQKFLIYNGKFPNILYNVMIGVSSGKLEIDEDFDALLGQSMV